MLKYKERPQLRAYLEILLSLATISIFGIFAIKPTALTIAQLLKEIEEKKTTLARMDEKIKNLEAAQQIYNQNIEKIVTLETSIPKRPKPEDFTRQVEGLSGKNGVEILKVSTSGGPLLGYAPAGENSQQLDEATGEIIQPPEFPLLGFSINMRVPIDKYSSLSEFTSDLLYKIRNPINIGVIRFDSQTEREEKSIILVVNGEIPYSP